MIETAIADHYLAAQRSFVALAKTLSDEDWATPVPCTPGWTVRDVLSHVSGVPDDALAGRLDGVATPPWTAAQVERNRGVAIGALLARWDDQAPLFADALAAMEEIRPPVDCHSHEHDVRHALARPGNRDSTVVRAAAESVVVGFGVPLTVELVDGSSIRSAVDGDEPVVLRGVSSFEVFRSRLGRRSVDQVRGYHWSGPEDGVAAAVGSWFGFGPSAIAIVE